METVEEFLARGGKINRIERGVSGENSKKSKRDILRGVVNQGKKVRREKKYSEKRADNKARFFKKRRV